MGAESKRIFWYDVVRAAAVVIMLMSHCIFAKFPDGNPDTARAVLQELLPFLFLQCCIGLFIMLSGALIIKKELAEGYPFYWRRTGKFLLLLVIWAVLNNVCGYVFNGQGLLPAFKQAVLHNTILFGGQHGFAGQLWFLPVIAHLYLAAPFLARMVKELPPEGYVIFAAATCGLFLLPGTLNVNGQYHSIFNADFSPLWGRFDVFGTFASWFILGYFLVDFDTEGFLRRYTRHGNALLAAGIALLTVTGGTAEYLLVRSAPRIYAPFHLFSESVFIYLEAILLFVLLKHTAHYFLRLRPVVEWLSKYSFGIFLCHLGLLAPVRCGLALVGVTTASPIYIVCPLAFLGMLVLSSLVASGLYECPLTRFLVK